MDDKTKKALEDFGVPVDALELAMEIARVESLFGDVGYMLNERFEHVEWTMIATINCAKCNKRHIVQVGTPGGAKDAREILIATLEEIDKELVGKDKQPRTVCPNDGGIH